jgi:hypothetical protein
MIPYVLPPHCQLPGQFGATVIGVANALQAPIELVTSVALAAASVAVQHNCTVQRKIGLDGPTTLYMLVVCAPGERKSAVQTLLFKELADFQRSCQQKATEEAKNFEVEHLLWKEKVQAARRALKQASRKRSELSEFEDRLRELYIAEPKPPKARKLLYADTTAEALLSGLHQFGNSAALVLDEFGQFVNGALASKLPLLNSLWSGTDTAVDRMSGESFVLHDARLSCLFQAQPEVFDRFIAKQGQQARGNGFLSRTLLGFPPSRQGWRAETYETACPKLDWFYERCKTLLSSNEQKVLKFSPAAQARWHAVSASYEQQMRPGWIFCDMKDFASKAAENIARVAAVLHAFETDDSDEISDEVMLAAINLVAWHAEQYRNLLSGTDPLVEKQRKMNELYNWISSTLMSRNWAYLFCTYLMQYGPNFSRKKATMEELLQSLAQSGKILIFYVGRKRVIQLLRPTFQLN